MTRVLIYTRTCGYVHASIPFAVQALQAFDGLFIRQGDDPALLHDLTAYDVVLFLSTSGEVVDETGRAALRAFVEGGGGFVGVHGASTSDTNWPWYGALVGARFAGHAEGVQRAVLTVVADPSRHWPFTDEWYAFTDLRDDLTILLTVDETTYSPGEFTMPGVHPQAWLRALGAGRMWYTALGHTEQAWSDPDFLSHVRDGIAYAAGESSVAATDGQASRS